MDGARRECKKRERRFIFADVAVFYDFFPLGAVRYTRILYRQLLRQRYDPRTSDNGLRKHKATTVAPTNEIGDNVETRPPEKTTAAAESTGRCTRFVRSSFYFSVTFFQRCSVFRRRCYVSTAHLLRDRRNLRAVYQCPIKAAL